MRLTLRRGDVEVSYDDPAAGVLDLPAAVTALLRAVPAAADPAASDDVHVDSTGQAVLADDVAEPGQSPRLPLGFAPPRNPDRRNGA